MLNGACSRVGSPNVTDAVLRGKPEHPYGRLAVVDLKNDGRARGRGFLTVELAEMTTAAPKHPQPVELVIKPMNAVGCTATLGGNFVEI
jgi:hypothetical protein